MQLRGVGRWTAEYVLLRGLGRLDIFPGNNVGARKKLAQFLRKKKPLDYEGVRRAVAAWQPYAGLVYFHLLLARITMAGWLCAHPVQVRHHPGLQPHAVQDGGRGRVKTHKGHKDTHEFNEMEEM